MASANKVNFQRYFW